MPSMYITCMPTVKYFILYFVPHYLRLNCIQSTMLQKTKLDDSFPAGQFYVDNFKAYRKDNNSVSGGLMIQVRGDLPQRRRDDLEVDTSDVVSGRIEILSIEVILQGAKWILCSMYKQPKVKNVDFKATLETLCDRLTKERANILVAGDMNVNLIKGGNWLIDVLDVYGLKNVVKQPTCHKNIAEPTLIDLMVTNVPKKLKTVEAITCDLSDFHDIVCIASKVTVPPQRNRHSMYRSYKKFDRDRYIKDIDNIPFHLSEVFDCIDAAYWFCNELLRNVVDDHAPIKR